MSSTCEVGRGMHAFWGRLALGFFLLGASSAQAGQSLGFFKNYFLTGDYVAGGVGLRGKGVNGFATGTITIDPSQIPAGAEIVAAYLYWETLGPSSGPVAATLAGARFQRNDIAHIAVLVNPGGSPACVAGEGDDRDDADNAPSGASRVYVYRSDVLPYFERITPADPTQPVRVVAAGPHEVTLPDAGSGRRLPSTLGAGLVVVYRVAGYDPGSLPLAYSAPKLPLKSIVIYDGGFTLNQGTPQLTVPMEGFYEASRSAPSAKLTQIVGNGRPGLQETVQVTSTLAAADNQRVAANPFVGSGGGGNPAGSTATGIDVITFPLPLEAGAMKARVSVSGGTQRNCGCLTFGASMLSTVVQDRDGDGLLDVWESQSEWSSKPSRLASVYGTWPLTEPTGGALPNLQLMGANPDVQDVFVQIDYMVGSDGHTHLPTKPTLDAIATAFHNAAPRPSLVAGGTCSASASSGQCPIAIHFDVGGNYQPPATLTPAGCAVAATWTPDCAIVSAAAAPKAGRIAEVLCTAAGTLAGSNPPVPCAFPGYAGVVGWKNGERAFRDAPVDVETHTVPCTLGQTGCEPRMPRNRKDVFHYALLAHALGYPSIENPRVPVANSGIADSNGGDLMITLGFWDNEVGTSFVQASTLMHELGHNFGLRHGGVSPSGVLEANCKPNYQSVMNYMFQVRGLWNSQGVPVIDYSRQLLPTLNESALVEATGLGATPAYQARWYAPLASNFIDSAIGTTPAPRHCDGTPVSATEPAYVIADAAPRVGGALDWNANGIIAGTQSQNANFDAVVGEMFTGADDYSTLDLRQIGGRRSVGSRALSYSVVDPATGIAPTPPAPPLGGGLSLDTLKTDLGYGDLGYGDLGYGDLGYGDLGYGDLGYGDLGYGDLGASFDGPASKGEPTPQVAASVGGGTPNSLRSAAGPQGAELNWAAPPVGTVISYQLYRVAGSTVTPATLATLVLVATLPGTVTHFLDSVGQHGGGGDSDKCEGSAHSGNSSATFTYFVVASVTNPGAPGTTLRSGPSNFSAVTVAGCDDEQHKRDR
ncbi:MAG TPA: hypothetical protein VGO37_06590 [Steroidobacteraceae bacterium]|nr:hypothetical protein [Steroidobacteraceae bacterium]